MDSLSGLTADVMPEPVTSMEVREWKIQLVAWVYFSQGKECHLVCLPLSGRIDV